MLQRGEKMKRNHRRGKVRMNRQEVDHMSTEQMKPLGDIKDDKYYRVYAVNRSLQSY